MYTFFLRINFIRISDIRLRFDLLLRMLLE